MENKIAIINLFRTDYLKRLHAREAARLLNISHTSASNYMRLLEKENILHSTTKGRNREYSLNFLNPMTKRYLIISEEYYCINALQKIPMLQNIPTKDIQVVFGSYADFTHTKKSDIDIFLLSEKDNSELAKFSRITGKDINVVHYTKFSMDPLIDQVQKKHIILQGAEKYVEHMWDYHAEMVFKEKSSQAD